MVENTENRPIAVKISGVKKMYKLGQIGGGTLQADLQSWWAKKRGREDPNTKIGEEERSKGDVFMALNGVDLTIYQGEAVGIIGKNGAGKSTLLKLLSRVTAPTKGEIDIYGRIASMLEVGTGFSGELTGRENVYMNGAILGMSKQEIDAKMEQIIEFSEVREFIDTPVKRYSSGMFVKLAFSVAAHLDAEIMIMDEVLAVGDMAFQKKCLTKMREAAKKDGRTVLYVSHNMNTIRQLCDRCILLDQGKTVFEGDVEEAITLYLDGESNKETVLNCATSERPDWIKKQLINVNYIEYLEKNSIVFNNDETMKIHINWVNLEDVSDMGLLIEVCTMDDIAQSTFELYDFYSGKSGVEVDATFECDISGFVPAEYKLRFTFFLKDDYGVGYTADWIQGLCFEKEKYNRGKKLLWVAKSWGYRYLPDPVVTSVKEKKM